jgi:hypothetical protein
MRSALPRSDDTLHVERCAAFSAKNLGKRIVLVAVAALTLGCAPDQPAPELAEVVPAWGYNGVTTDIRVLGRNFLPRVEAKGKDEVGLDRQFELQLSGPETASLTAVAMLSYDELVARVPMGLSTGDYTLSVIGPGGASDSLEAAFEVTDTPADHFRVSSAPGSHPLHSPVLINFQLLDRDGQAVALDLPVKVSVHNPTEAPEFTFSSTTLSDWEEIDDAGGLQGRLSPTGQGQVGITAEEPGELILEVDTAIEGSLVEGERESLSFVAGAVSRLSVELPFTGYVPTVGEPFGVTVQLQDEEGLTTQDVTGQLRLTEVCGRPGERFTETVAIVDSASIGDVVLTRATTHPDCPKNALTATFIGSDIVLDGSTGDIEVEPGEVDHLAVETLNEETVAGGSPILLILRAEDRFGNPNPDYSQPVTLWDSLGGLNPTTGRGEQSCAGFGEDGDAWCSAVLWAAGDGVVITAIGEDGVIGESGALRVLPADPVGVTISVAEVRVAAGAPFGARVSVADSYGNAVGIDGVGEGAPIFSDDGGPVDCLWVVEDVEQSNEYSCVVTRAEPGKELTVGLPLLRLSGHSGPFDAVNGPLTTARLDLGGVTEVEAGGALSVDISTFDAYGNPYTVQTIAALSLYDDAGNVPGALVNLDADGEASISRTFIHAMYGDRLRLLDLVGTTTYGVSAPFDVLGGPAVALELSLGSSWVEVNQPLAVGVGAVDTFGNPDPTWISTVTLTSVDGLGPPAYLSDWQEGRVEATWTPVLAGLMDQLRVAGDGLAVESGDYDAVVFDCIAGPSASVTLDGTSLDRTLCRSGAGTTREVEISTAGSAAGDRPVVAWHFDTGVGGWWKSSQADLRTSWTEEGAYFVDALVVDSVACADRVSLTVWVADDDGEPAGPIALALADVALINGSATDGTTTVSVSATDCTGDPAVAGTLYLRPDLGELQSAGSTLSSSGQGLEVVLDGNGEAEVGWSMLSEIFTGTASVQAGVFTGAAWGSATATVSSDGALPYVLAVSPTGSTDESFTQVGVQFSEAMRSISLGSTLVAVTRPDGSAATVTAVDWSSDMREVTLTLDEAGSGLDGIWSVALASAVKDSAGNRIDGNYSGVASPFFVAFGGVVATAPSLVECSPDTSVFRPDGDAGALPEEADAVVLAVEADALPVWWHLQVFDEEGSLTFADRLPATGLTDSLTWAGVALSGLVVENGLYSAVITAEDAAWNPSEACTVDLLVDNQVRAPE